MLKAEIKRLETNYLATFELKLNHPKETVWSWITDNDKLSQWFSELHIETLEKGGLVKFDFGDGTFEEMVITDFVPGSVIQYTWGKDEVRFEVDSDSRGSKLILRETIDKVTEHTAKDLAGWQVCLQVIDALINEENVERQLEWEKWFDVYQTELKKVAQ